MNGARCNFCKRSFHNRQAVRAHLKACDAYRQHLLQAGVPSSSSTEAVPEPQEHEGAPREVDAERAERARQREHDRTSAWLREQAARADREQRAAVERAAGDQRRRTIQRVKDRVIRASGSLPCPIPAAVIAQALTAIEAELSKLPVNELPESELVTIAEGIRDRFYEPVIRAQARAREEGEQRRKRWAQLTESGSAYARRTLNQRTDLDSWTRFILTQKVTRALEQEITGDEVEADVRARVEAILAPELEPLEEKNRQQARRELIERGAAYAARELAREADLDASERQQIAGGVRRTLEQEVTGDEEESDVKAFVDEILDEELGEVADDEDEELDDDLVDEDDAADDDEGDEEYEEEEEGVSHWALETHRPSEGELDQEASVVAPRGYARKAVQSLR